MNGIKMWGKRAQILYVKLALGLGLGAFIGYSITNTDLGAIVGAALGAYLALKVWTILKNF